MENIKMHEFKHPKYYTELRKLRNKEARRVQGCLPTNELHNSDQAISKNEDDGQSERASDPGHKLKETNCSFDKNPNPQASSDKLQAPSRKHQAPSRKRQAP